MRETYVCRLLVFAFVLTFSPKALELGTLYVPKDIKYHQNKIFKILLLNKNYAAIRQLVDYRFFSQKNHLNRDLLPYSNFKKAMALTYRNHG
jgi:hypothetical protein